MSDFDGHFPEDNYSERDQREAQRIFEQVIDAAELLGPLSAARYEVVDKLERIEQSKLGPLMNESCSICYNTFAAIIAEEEMLLAMDTPISEKQLGVTKLQTCGHYFCRKDITKWILEGNDLCPYCRVPYLPSTRNGPSGTDGTSRDEARPFMPSVMSLESVMEHLQDRWETAASGNPNPARRGAGQRQQSSSAMYS
ncbi:hypothetical protein CPB86DRAFT_202596 [Serendipita vermifera]|nr:hypothetical protein CPB86DRAFT_202596 [Serendipita vermifera]